MKRVAGLLIATCLMPALIYAQAVAYDYSKLYESSSPAVVQVTTQDGQVIGINTFGEANISGAIRIDALRDFLSSPELMAQSKEVQPPADQLRSISSRYPVDALNHKIDSEPLDLSAYRIQAGDFSVTAITPVLIGKLQVFAHKRRASNREERRGKNISDASHGDEEPYYEWHRSTETSLDYAVTFEI